MCSVVQFCLQVEPYIRKSDDQLHLLCQVEIFMLLLCAYATINTEGFIAAGSSTDILLSVVLIILTGELFLYVLFSLLVFLREEYYALMRKVKKLEQQRMAREQEGALTGDLAADSGTTIAATTDSATSADAEANTKTQPSADGSVEMTTVGTSETPATASDD